MCCSASVRRRFLACVGQRTKGGRMSTCSTAGDLLFDHCCQYFFGNDSEFARQAKLWIELPSGIDVGCEEEGITLEPVSVPCRQGTIIRVAARGPLVFSCARELADSERWRTRAVSTQRTHTDRSWIHHVSIPCHDSVRLPPFIPLSFATPNSCASTSAARHSLCTLSLYATTSGRSARTSKHRTHSGG